MSTQSQPQSRPKIIGLIGGVASGKSVVAEGLAKRGGLWINADKAAHEVLNQPEVIEKVISHFGTSVIASTGLVDRRALAQKVFGPSDTAQQNRKALESWIHPRLRSRLESQIRDAGQRYPAIIIDAPLLLEAGWASMCDRIVLVDTPLSLRQSLAASRGWDGDELARREASQMPLLEKRSYATDILPNAGTLEELDTEVTRFWSRIHSGV